MAEATFTFRVDDELKAQFTEAAKSHDRTGAQLLRDFMRDNVKRQQDEAEYDAWFRHQVKVGIESARAGRLIPAEEVEAEFAARRAAARRISRPTTLGLRWPWISSSWAKLLA